MSEELKVWLIQLGFDDWEFFEQLYYTLKEQNDPHHLEHGMGTHQSSSRCADNGYVN